MQRRMANLLSEGFCLLFVCAHECFTLSIKLHFLPLCNILKFILLLICLFSRKAFKNTVLCLSSTNERKLPFGNVKLFYLIKIKRYFAEKTLINVEIKFLQLPDLFVLFTPYLSVTIRHKGGATNLLPLRRLTNHTKPPGYL